MTYKKYVSYINDYKELGSSEQLLGEIGYPADIDLTPTGLITAIDVIAAVADGDIKNLVTISGLNMRQFALKYMIPYRTIQDWCAEISTPPKYIPMLIGYEMITELPKLTGE